MTRAIKKYFGDFAAILALFALALGTAGYIIINQDARPYLPLIEPPPKTIEAELTSAQAVVPGQGQSVRIAGVEVGKITGIEVEDGLAIVEMQIHQEFENVVHEDASALLRPRTGLKDMFMELDPGTEDTPVMPEGGRITVENTAPDIDPDEVLSALDTDTRAYLKLLVNGAGKGLDNRGDDVREVFQRFLPLHRDLERVQGAFADRREALRQLVHNYGVLTQELGRNDDALQRLVVSSNDVFEALAGEDDDISQAIALLPGTLEQTEATLRRVDVLGGVLGPTLDDLRPAMRELDRANDEVLPLVRRGTPIVRDEIRPFVRNAQPYVETLRPTTRNLAAALPDLTTSFGELNRFFNTLAFNPAGPDEAGAANPEIGNDPWPGNNVGTAGDPRDEGYLYWLAWVVNNSVSLHSSSDAEGTMRRGSFSLNCQSLQSLIVPQLPAPLRAGLEMASGVLPPETLETILRNGIGPLGGGFQAFADAFNNIVTEGNSAAFIDALLQCIGLGEIDFSSDGGAAAASADARAERAPSNERELSEALEDLEVSRRDLQELEERAIGFGPGDAVIDDDAETDGGRGGEADGSETPSEEGG